MLEISCLLAVYFVFAFIVTFRLLKEETYSFGMESENRRFDMLFAFFGWIFLPVAILLYLGHRFLPFGNRF